ncbi:MAG: hypothetical protein ACQERK_06595 [Campylobacterota bacterium]
MEKIKTVDDFLDAGYMAEAFDACDRTGKKVTLHPCKKPAGMQLFVCVPTLDKPYETQVLALDELLQKLEVSMACYLILSSKVHPRDIEKGKTLKAMNLLIDDESQFGQMYGTQIVSSSYRDLLYKALFLISRDGAVFYVDMPGTLQDDYDLKRFTIEANKAYGIYNGTGCHA